LSFGINTFPADDLSRAAFLCIADWDPANTYGALQAVSAKVMLPKSQ
jgi:hypothetical protein